MTREEEREEEREVKRHKKENPLDQEKNPVDQEKNPLDQEKNPLEIEKNPLEQFQVENCGYIPLSLKPIPNSLTFEQNMKYEKLYIELQAEKKEKSKNNGSSVGLKFDKRQQGSVKRIPKKKVALLLSYCGTGYNGMQINPSVASIELDLHKALAESGAVSQENAMNPAKSQFMRCARTDKGVHAGGQVVSLKLMIIPDIIEKINNCLPEQIRVWGLARVKNSFDAKEACSSRIYEYLFPTYCLDMSRVPARPDTAPSTHQPLTRDAFEAATPEEIKRNNEFRVDEETLTKFRQTLKEYEGTHNFHNFTQGKSFTESSCRRYIMDISVSDPFIPTTTGGEWVSVKIHGQSFMLHQIRKMIGLAILMIRSGSLPTLIQTAFESDRLNIPKAPALGLLLEKPLFGTYNDQSKAAVAADSTLERDAIDFTPYEPLITAFKQKWIYNSICHHEETGLVFRTWLVVVDACWADYSWYLQTVDGKLDLEKRPVDLFRKGGGAMERADSILDVKGAPNEQDAE